MSAVADDPASDVALDEIERSESLTSTPQHMRFSLKLLIAFLVAVVIRPWDFIPGLAAIKPVTLGILGILTIMSIAGVKIRYFSIPLSKSLLAFWLMMLVTATTSYWIGHSLDFTIKWFQFLLLFSFVGTLVVSTAGLFELTRTITWVGGGLGLLAIYSKLTAQLAVDGRIEGVGEGFLSDPNELAQALVTVLPFAWWIVLCSRGLFDRLIGLVCITVMLAGTIATESRGGFLSVIAVGSILLVLSRASIGRKAAVVALLGVLVLAMMPSDAAQRYSTITTAAQTDESAQTRLAVWSKGAQMFGDHFLMGTGVGTFEIVYGTRYMDRQNAGDKWYSAHNSIVEVAVELGIVGLIAWLCFTLMPFLLLWRSRSALLACDEDESKTRATLIVWLECMLAAWAGFFVGAMFLSKGFDVPVVIFVGLAIAGAQIADGWVAAIEDAEIEDADEESDTASGSLRVGNTGS